MNNFILKGDICYSKNINNIEAVPNGYVVCVDGKSKGVFSEIPDKYKDISVVDYSGKIIIPGFYDLHTHAPQYSFIGTNMDYELLSWLEKVTFPEETKYSDMAYAERTYDFFTNELKKSATVRACIFSTIHKDTTLKLMELLEQTGLICFVGKVNMDRQSPKGLCEETVESLEETIDWLGKCGDFKNIKPIVTPRFIPSCSDKLMNGLSEIREKFGLSVQSHLSENISEQELVKKLCPKSEFYGDGYDTFGLFGKSNLTGEKFNTVMAHCVYSCDDELRLMKENNVFVAHCPASNANLASGIAPIRKMIQMEINIGMGTDVAAGNSLSMFRCITDAIMMSKLYGCLIDSSCKPLTFDEAFYIATKGGGEFFGKCGSFEKDYEFDAVILEDSQNLSIKKENIKMRLERFAYLSGDMVGIKGKYVKGRKIKLC